MRKPVISEAETRSMLLLSLRDLGCVTEGQLLDFVTDCGFMNYFSLQFALTDLEESGLLRRRLHPLGSLVELVPGVQLPELEIKPDREQLIKDKILRNLRRYQKELQSPALAIRQPDGSWCLRMMLMEGDSTLVDLMLESEEYFPNLQEAWEKAATTIYSVITSTLSDSFERVPPRVPLPEGTAMKQGRGTEWTLYLASDQEGPAMTLITSLPDRELCRHWARRWPACRAEMYRAVLALLRTSAGAPEHA
ncbi:MAG: DUF4364 family protein [Clostridia bacterium]|nr:DUF4364 family protein [Clostridia bacterium]